MKHDSSFVQLIFFSSSQVRAVEQSNTIRLMINNHIIRIIVEEQAKCRKKKRLHGFSCIFQVDLNNVQKKLRNYYNEKFLLDLW